MYLTGIIYKHDPRLCTVYPGTGAVSFYLLFRLLCNLNLILRKISYQHILKLIGVYRLRKVIRKACRQVFFPCPGNSVRRQ